MRATAHMPDRLDLAADIAAGGTIHSNIPRYPPPCVCPDCQTYYYTLEEQMFHRYHYTEVLTDDQAKAILTSRVRDIYSAQEYLRQSVQQHGDYILSHWRKHNRQRRTEILRIAEPDLPNKKGYHAEIEYSTTSLLDVRNSSTCRKHFLLPYLDVETLANNPAALIGLIHTRAKDGPADWASYDHEQLRTPWGAGLVDVAFNAGAVVMFGPRYGTYTKWEKEAAHRFDMIGFPRGTLLIEAQATLMNFLRRVVQKLLADVRNAGPTAVGATQWNTTVDSGLKMSHDTTPWSNFVHTPFTAPPRFDVDALVALVKARVAATGDHLGLLQTETSYLKRYMRKLYQMQAVESARQKHVAIVIINDEIVEDINTHWFWRGTLLEFEHLRNVYHRYRDSIAAGTALPKKVDEALRAIELVLVNTIHHRSLQLQAIIGQRPGFRNMYEYQGTTMNSQGGYNTSAPIKKFAEDANEGNAIIYRTQRLWWILMELQGAPDSQTRFRYATLLDMLDDHLMSSDSVERARLDEILYEKLSDYATLLELLWSVRMHCPRNSIGTTESCEKTEDRLIWRAWKNAKATYVPETSSTVKALVDFRSLKAPAGPQNREWLQQFDDLHGALQDFWRETSIAYRNVYEKKGMSKEDIEYSMKALQSWNDPEYIARLDQKRNQIEANMQKSKTVDSEDVFLPLPTTPAPSKLDISQHVKTKTKTQGTSTVQAPPQVAETAQAPAFPTKTIPLSKNPYATLRRMFPLTLEEGQKRIKWSVFVNSMHEAGFTARNAGGSIVRFENRNGEGSINFHRPHPDSTIDPVMLQAMGWRMNKWFGWVRETFVLEKK